MGRTQPAKFGESWDDSRIVHWLNIPIPSDTNPDFHRLWHAYQAMRVYDFERFVQLFLESGGNINACSPQGETLMDIISRHELSVDFKHILEDAGCKV